MTAVEPAMRTHVSGKAHSPEPGRAGRGCQIPGATVTPLGVSFEPRFPFEEWAQLGPRVAMRANASLWWLGDWLAFGQAKYGRRYKAGIAATNLDYQTLRNYAVVARRFELSRRRDSLSFQHHAEVCGLRDAEQDDWLDRAAANGWSRNELRRRMRAQLGRAAGRTICAPIHLVVEANCRERWAYAAKHVDCTLEEWMVSTLDEAANGLLEPPDMASGPVVSA